MAASPSSRAPVPASAQAWPDMPRARHDGRARRHRRRRSRRAPGRARPPPVARRVDVVCDVRDPDAVEHSPSARTAISDQCGCWSTTQASSSSAICGTHRSTTGNGSSTSTSAVSSTGSGRSCRKMIDAGAPAWVWNLSSIGGVAVGAAAGAVHHEQARRARAHRVPAPRGPARRPRPHPRSGRAARCGGVQHLRVRGRCQRRRRAAAESQRDAMLDIKAERDGSSRGRAKSSSSRPPKGGSTCSPSLTTSARRWPNAQKSLSPRSRRRCGQAVVSTRRASEARP